MIINQTDKLTASYWPSQQNVVVSVKGLPIPTKWIKGIREEDRSPYTKVVFSNISDFKVAIDLDAIGKFTRMVSQGLVKSRDKSLVMVYENETFTWKSVDKTETSEKDPLPHSDNNVWDRIATALETIAAYITGKIGGQA